MFNPIPPKVKQLWDQWNVRGAVLFSLLLQILIILLAPLRKRTSRKFIILLIWSGYLLADATANFAVGLISNSQSNHPGSGSGSGKSLSSENSDLLAFWSPFLLVHLGGPDTITAFSLEDNALWHRHLLAFVFQAAATGYVFLQTLPSNKLMIPTFLLFLSGIIKYLERTRSLYLASMDRFRDSMLTDPDPGPNYAKLMDEYASKKDAKLPTQIIMIPEPEKPYPPSNIIKYDDVQVVQKAYWLFNIFKGLIVDLIFSFKERTQSREFFNRISPVQALQVIEVELNFIYDVLFTKAVVVHSRWGYFFRFISISSIVAALLFFHLHIKKDGFNRFDVEITYALLYGAIGLEVIAIFLAFFSDWTVATLTEPDNPSESGWKSILVYLSSLTNPLFKRFLVLYRSKTIEETSDKHKVFASPIMCRRWSESVSGYNLIRYCIKGRPSRIYHIICTSDIIIDKFISLLQLKEIIAVIENTICEAGKRVSDRIHKVIQALHIDRAWNKVIDWINNARNKVIDWIGLKDFVDEIMYVSKEPFTEDLWKFIFDELKMKSDFAVEPETTRRICSAKGDWVLQDYDLGKHRDALMPYIEVTYDESLLLWHLATELLYNDPDDKVDKENYSDREFSKILSDYVLYLLVIQPTMVQAVAGIGKIRFRDTCAEAERFFKRRGLHSHEQKKACKLILEVNTEVEPIAVKGDRSKSVLFDGCRLAKELQKLQDKKWTLLSKMWVELLSYAASNCRANAHAQQVSKGGDLITFVWLLMAHFGLGNQFQINEGHARAKLVVGK